MSNFYQVTPFLHVADLPKALDFFTGVLGFAIAFRDGNYAYIERESVAFRLLEAEPGCEPTPHGGFAYYIDVRDVDALYAELKPKLDGLPPKDVHGPADKPYNQRELLVRAPDGNLICFGMAIPQVAKA